MMGCSPGYGKCRNDENPPHQVNLSQAYRMRQTPVTEVAFQRMMGANPSHFRGDDLPVEQVTWEQSISYCQAAGGRLPPEAEFEYSARAASTEPRYGVLNAIAWWGAKSGGTTHPVGQKLPNAWGLYDMIGNVCEWTQDFWGGYYGGGQIDPTGPPSGDGRAARGGSWLHGKTVWFRASSRYGQGTAGRFRWNNLGFRCVIRTP
jgi:formylglycine-generating enzyme required for sulfatase activity